MAGLLLTPCALFGGSTIAAVEAVSESISLPPGCGRLLQNIDLGGWSWQALVRISGGRDETTLSTLDALYCRLRSPPRPAWELEVSALTSPTWAFFHVERSTPPMSTSSLSILPTEQQWSVTSVTAATAAAESILIPHPTPSKLQCPLMIRSSLSNLPQEQHWTIATAATAAAVAGRRHCHQHIFFTGSCPARRRAGPPDQR